MFPSLEGSWRLLGSRRSWRARGLVCGDSTGDPSIFALVVRAAPLARLCDPQTPANPAFFLFSPKWSRLTDSAAIQRSGERVYVRVCFIKQNLKSKKEASGHSCSLKNDSGVGGASPQPTVMQRGLDETKAAWTHRHPVGVSGPRPGGARLSNREGPLLLLGVFSFLVSKFPSLVIFLGRAPGLFYLCFSRICTQWGGGVGHQIAVK